VIDLWKTNMKRIANTPDAKGINMLEMNAYTKMGNATRSTGAKTVGKYLRPERYLEEWPTIKGRTQNL